MAAFLQKILGGAPSAVPNADDAGFADFAASPAAPSPASIATSAATSTAAAARSFFAAPSVDPNVPYTKWYRIWERTSRKDFFTEMVIIPFIIVVVLIHVWGTNANRRKAKAWIAAHAKPLQDEFAVVGFGGYKGPASGEETQTVGSFEVPKDSMQEDAANKYSSYATGRQNVAFVDVKISLLKRYSPLMLIGELLFSLLFESIEAPKERMEATAYAFDGKEKELVPASGDGEQRKGGGNSTYDGFVFAVVNKDVMKQLRDERYDLSLTSTKDHPKLPVWATVMSESAEITETMLTPELVKAVTECGESLEAFVITDQPIEKPTKLQETVPRKRITLSIRVPSGTDPKSYDASLPLFKTFLRMPDYLVANARFRPEVLRRVKATREDEIKRIRKVDDDEKAEERKNERDKAKKEKRDKDLRGLSSAEQKKYLEKEREKELRKGQKKMTTRG